MISKQIASCNSCLLNFKHPRDSIVFYLTETEFHFSSSVYVSCLSVVRVTEEQEY